MSVDPIGRKKRAVGDTVKRTSEDDHRRKRRNRTTQSCLNCHTSKRMCDRKRPCGRCTQLGLTGLCVYEVDDPSQSHESHDERSRLQKRVAELESVIREMKNKPHPRWINTGPPGTGRASPSNSISVESVAQVIPTSPAGSSDSKQSASSKGYASPSHLRTNSSPFLAVLSSNISSPTSPMNTPSPLSLSSLNTQLPSVLLEHRGSEPECDLSNLFSSSQAEAGHLEPEDRLFDDIFDHLVGHDGTCNSGRISDHCGCLNDSANYNVVLELSLRLRKAAELLGRSWRHHRGTSTCPLNQSIAELDRFATLALGNIAVPSQQLSPYSYRLSAGPAVSISHASSYVNFDGAGSMSSTNGPTIPPLSLQSLGLWDIKAPTACYPSPPWDDPFMSWAPQRQ